MFIQYDYKSFLIKDTQLLQKEIHILSRLFHPNVIQFFGMVSFVPLLLFTFFIIGTCQSDNEMWIIMEFADGGSLYDLLNTNNEGEVYDLF